MRATYYDPRTGQMVDAAVESIDDFARIAEVVARLKTQRGIPTIELFRHGGSSLGFSSDGERAFLVWVDSLGDSYHTIGGGFDDVLVFDYLGSWSEAPGEYLVPYMDACEAVGAFLSAGSPVTQSVMFSPE